MNEAATPETPVVAAPPDLSVDGVEHMLAQLHKRVGDLETEVAQLRDTKRIEDRILDRVTTKISALPPVAPPADFEERILRRVTANLPKPEIARPDLDVPTQPSLSSVIEVAKSTWILVRIFQEIKTAFWWLSDARYHAAWWTRSLVLVIFLFAIFSDFLFPLSWIRYVGWIFDKLLILVLGGIITFLVSRENDRYREWWKQRR